MKIIIQSFGDIITNSSTETFCISNGSVSDLQLLIDTILKVYGINNSSIIVKEIVDYEDYENWDPNINKLSLKYLPEGLRTIRAMIPDTTFAMYSKDDNPTWEYQEKFERLGKRYHLG
jgi:hypothetical protein